MTRSNDLVFVRSSLKCCKVLQFQMHNSLQVDCIPSVYQGISSSLALFLPDPCSSSASSSSALDKCLMILMLSGRVHFQRLLDGKDIPEG